MEVRANHNYDYQPYSTAEKHEEDDASRSHEGGHR